MGVLGFGNNHNDQVKRDGQEISDSKEKLMIKVNIIFKQKSFYTYQKFTMLHPLSHCVIQSSGNQAPGKAEALNKEQRRPDRHRPPLSPITMHLSSCDGSRLSDL
jgi:hypothetical protein